MLFSWTSLQLACCQKVSSIQWESLPFRHLASPGNTFTEACLLVYFQSNQAGNQNDLSHQFRAVQSLSFYLFENYSSQSSLCYDKILDKCNYRREGLIWVHDLRRDMVHHGRRPSHGSNPGSCSFCVCGRESREGRLVLSLSPPIYFVQHCSPQRGAAHSWWVFSPQLTLWKFLHRRHAHTSVSQVVLNPVRLAKISQRRQHLLSLLWFPFLL